MPAANTNRKNKIIGVVSGKGGVGKSVVAVNTTAILKRMGRNSIIVDCDLSNPSTGLHLGLSYGAVGIQEVLQGKNKVSEAVVVQPQTGIRVLPASLKYHPDVSLKNLKNVLWSMTAYDYIIVDSPPGITSDVEYILETCDEVIVITTPDVPSSTSAAKVVSLCQDKKTRVRGIVVNRSTGSPFELSNKEIETMAEVPVIFSIPEDHLIPESIAARTPIVLYKGSSPAARVLKEGVGIITGSTEPMHAREGFFGRVWRIFRRVLRR
ncbi:MinD/ParA family protein [Candidatus Micrarchaeota archaeon]|nr:MinD/ParA family protein [Candidatus Micrarchaeota archaeon]